MHVCAHIHVYVCENSNKSRTEGRRCGSRRPEIAEMCEILSRSLEKDSRGRPRVRMRVKRRVEGIAQR